MISREDQVGTQDAYACCPKDCRDPYDLVGNQSWLIFDAEKKQFIPDHGMVITLKESIDTPASPSSRWYRIVRRHGVDILQASTQHSIITEHVNFGEHIYITEENEDFFYIMKPYQGWMSKILDGRRTAVPVEDDIFFESELNPYSPRPHTEEDVQTDFIFSYPEPQEALLSCCERVDVLALSLAYPQYRVKWIRDTGFTDCIIQEDGCFILAWIDRRHWHYPSTRPLLQLSQGIEEMIDILDPEEQVVQIIEHESELAFAAVKSNGNILTWPSTTAKSHWGFS